MINKRKAYLTTCVTLFSFIVVLSFLSCNKMMKGMYGIKDLTSFDSIAYTKTTDAIKREYSGDIQFIVSDTTQFRRYRNLDLGEYDHALLQPVQILYFENDALKSYHANCFAKGGVGNLNWNVDGRFDSFIPNSAINIDSIDVSNNLLSDIYHVKTDEKKVIVFVFWSNYLAKISESAIRLVLKNIEEANEVENTSVILVNTDYFYITAFDKES